MSSFFMNGTSLEGIEQLMMMAPNFSPRRSGIVINNYFNFEGDGAKCNCYGDVCFYLKARDLDEIIYKDLMPDLCQMYDTINLSLQAKTIIAVMNFI